MATVNIAYAASATLTNAVESLATSSTFVAGYESAVFDNTTTKYDDVLLAGKVTTGTAPTVNTNILIYVVAPIDDTPTWPDVFDGTTSGETLTSVNMGSGFLKLAAVITVTATSDLGYHFGPVSVAQLFGGIMPYKFLVYTTHNTAVNLNATGGNHVFKTTGITYTVA